MKFLALCFLVFITPFQLFSQAMVRVNMVALADEVPLPPADVNAAWQRLECTEVNMSLRCSADKFFQSVEQELASVKQQLEQLNLTLTAPAPSGIQDINPEEIQKKMATMTPAEQMQFAMQLNEQMGFGPRSLQPEPDEVIAALEAHNELATQISMELMNPSPEYQKRLALAQERQERHQTVDGWFKAEYDKLPQVSFGEAGRGPEPKAEYALRLAALEKHIAAENEYLQALNEFWQQYRDYLKGQYDPFQEKLAAINYGDDVVNVENKRILVGGQGLLLAPAENLAAFSREATDAAAKWWIQKLDLEKQKPQ